MIRRGSGHKWRFLATPFIFAAVAGASCATGDVFQPKSEYPPDPYVKGYADPQDCLGGENLAAISLDLPDYPRKAFRTGRQGWVVVRLDVEPDGQVGDVSVEQAVPRKLFERAAVDAVSAWQFEPPENEGLRNCRVLLRFRFGEVSLGG